MKTFFLRLSSAVAFIALLSADAGAQTPPPPVASSPFGSSAGLPVYVPPGAVPPPGYRPIGLAPSVPMERRSTGMMVSGIALTGLSAGAIVASFFWGVSSVFQTRSQDHDRQGQVALGLLVGGAVGLGVGIPLWVVGSGKVPVGGSAATDEAKLVVSPSKVSLRMPF